MASNVHALSSVLEQARACATSVRFWLPRRWLAAALATSAAALVVGVPTGVVSTPLFTRMTQVTWWDYPVWGLSAVLVGLTAATYVPIGNAVPSRPDAGRRTLVATLLSGLAVGCPICNKLVVALLGASGALTYWGPIQPVLGVLSLALLAAGLALRLRGSVVCTSSPLAN